MVPSPRKPLRGRCLPTMGGLAVAATSGVKAWNTWPLAVWTAVRARVAVAGRVEAMVGARTDSDLYTDLTMRADAGRTGTLAWVV